MVKLKIFLIILITLAFYALLPKQAFSKEIILFGFEKDPQGWEIPAWALEKKDHVAKQIGISEFQASEGKCALQVDVNFSGSPQWEGAYVERLIDVTDWSPFNYISVDIFLPKDGPRGLKAKMILTVGDEWKWTEMNKGITLAPGEWIVIKADLTPSSMNWRRFIDDAFRGDVRKLGVRIESNGKISYKGPIYIDNVKLSTD